MKNRVLIGFFVFTVTVAFLVSVGATNSLAKAKDKDKIVIGASRPISGPLAFFEANGFGPIYKMWVEMVNADGGIYVKEYKKKLPVEMKVYDDKSDMGTMTRLLDKLILQDKVDFIFSPVSTAFLFAASAVANRHHYILLGAEGGATTLTEKLPEMPYFFGVLNYSDHYQMPALAEVFADLGVESAAIMFIEDLHGIEYQGVATREFLRKGIEVKMVKSVPFGTKDVSHILKEAQKSKADAFCAFNYPPTVFLATGTAQAIGYNPKAILFGPGGNFEVYKKIFGQETIEGVMGEGAWNEKTSKGAKEFVEEFTKRYPRDILDWWGHLFYWAGLEFFKQAIEKAGTLDQKKIRKVMAKSKFDTVLGKTWFDMYDGGGGLLARECQPGQIGQWQNGVFEVIGPKDKATAKPIYPKSPWPPPKPKPE